MWYHFSTLPEAQIKMLADVAINLGFIIFYHDDKTISIRCSNIEEIKTLWALFIEDFKLKILNNLPLMLG